MKISKSLLLAAAIGATFASPAFAANILYHGTDSLLGVNIDYDIETNGTVGNLALTDIVGSSITFSGTSSSRYGAFLPQTFLNRLYFTNENGLRTLTATEGNLFFDFANGGNLNFDFNEILTGDLTQQSFAYALAGRGITDGDAVVYGHGNMATRELDDAREYANLTPGTYVEVDLNVEPANQIIATATSPGAVPEPATWAMMIMGFGMIGFGMRYSMRKSNAKFDLKLKRIAAGLEA